MSHFPSAKGELFRYADPAACVAFEYNLSPHEMEGSGGVSEEKTAAATSTKTADDASASTIKKTKLAVVAVGGLTDGFFALPYLPHLAELLRTDTRAKKQELEWSLVTPLLSSSHRGWGTSSLDRDAGELLELSAHLAKHKGVEGIALV